MALQERREDLKEIVVRFNNGDEMIVTPPIDGYLTHHIFYHRDEERKPPYRSWAIRWTEKSEAGTGDRKDLGSFS